MRHCACCLTSTSPASRSTRRCRETPGRAIGSASASSPTVAGCERRISSIVRLLPSASACSNASMPANVPDRLYTRQGTYGRDHQTVERGGIRSASERGRDRVCEQLELGAGIGPDRYEHDRVDTGRLDRTQRRKHLLRRTGGGEGVEQVVRYRRRDRRGIAERAELGELLAALEWRELRRASFV